MAWPAAYGRIVLKTAESTNDEARARAEAGERGPLWVLALEQTKGRGRRGRDWVAKPGNLFATLLLEPGCPAGDTAQLSFVAALAVRDMLARYVAAERVRLKWPNDVEIDGLKAAGLLLEAAPARGVVPWVVIGIGINLAEAPGGEGISATALADATGTPPPAPETALEALALTFEHWLSRWRAEGFAPVRAAWMKGARGLGEPVTVRLMDRTLEGRFEGIDETGALLISPPGGGEPETIAAGDVYFRTAS